MSKFQRESSKSTGSWLSAQIKFKGDVVGCLPILKDGTVEIANDKVIKVSRKNVPDNLFEGKHVIKLSEDKKTILLFKPYTGQHPGKFVEFSHRENESSIPQTETGQYGPYLVCYPIFEIVDGPYKGCKTSYKVPYMFKEGSDGITKFSATKGKFLEQAEEFLDTVIGDFDPPQWPDSGNLLPGLQKLALRSNRTVGLVFKKGWIVTLVELENSGDNPPWKKTPDVE